MNVNGVMQRWSDRGIPKGFCNEAQGCEERATLGGRYEMDTNPNGVVASTVAMMTQPRWGWFDFGWLTQGNSFLATLGWRTQSIWDWAKSSIVNHRS